MNDSGPNERLLADILGEGVAADFREGLLHEALHLARRRRRFRQMRGAASALAVLAGLGLLVWHPFPSGRAPESSPAKPYTIVRTQPLPPAALVRTAPLSPACFVATMKTGNIVATAEAGTPIREINDDELLALVPKPAALVRFGPHTAELVFVDPADR
ncbi:MAG: hypothetical protein NT154_27685, partial [Verrucomicrobia bacterium]|nr:hypothetical protein [Verrucomicrobiota bacterium]